MSGAALRSRARVTTQEMRLAWDEYGSLERSVEQLRAALQAQMSHSAPHQVRAGTAASSERVRERVRGAVVCRRAS